MAVQIRRGWQRWDWSESRNDLSGCYAIYRAGHLWYIGESSNLRARLFHHWTVSEFHGDTVKVKLETRRHSRLQTEAALIARLIPPKNGRVTPSRPISKTKPVPSPAPTVSAPIALLPAPKMKAATNAGLGWQKIIHSEKFLSSDQATCIERGIWARNSKGLGVRFSIRYSFRGQLYSETAGRTITAARRLLIQRRAEILENRFDPKRRVLVYGR
jgi:hypothetical protein